MKQKPSIIVINGRKYDAVTGQLVDDAATQKTAQPGPRAANVDGFSQGATTQPKQAASNLHLKPQKTQKLHAAAVKKSAEQVKQAQPKMPKLDITPTTAKKVVPKPSQTADALRAQRASLVAKSEKIRKFTSDTAADSPAQQQASVAAPQPENPPEPVDLRELSASLAQPNTEQQSRPEQPADQPEQTRNRFASLANMRSKLVYVSAGATALLIGVGLFAYLNMPSLSLRVATQRAGFGVELPGYSPSGYSFSGPVSSSEGYIELEYSSNSDDRNYTISQKKSAWDSLSLLNDFVLENSESYLTFREQGLTIYVYDDTNATWVDGGIWYKVHGNTLLTNEQLLKIASSL